MKFIKILQNIKIKSIAIKIELKNGEVLHHFINLHSIKHNLLFNNHNLNINLIAYSK